MSLDQKNPADHAEMPKAPSDPARDSYSPLVSSNDPAFKDQFYWRGRIWGPVNYLVYLGLRNYDDPTVRREFAQKSYELFLQEWNENRHVHENYNAVTGSGDDVTSSDRYYHWGALLGYEQYLEQSEPVIKGQRSSRESSQ